MDTVIAGENTMHTVRQAPRMLLTCVGLLYYMTLASPLLRTENKSGHSNYIMHDAVGAYMAEGVGHRLKWSNDRRFKVVETVLHHLGDGSPIRAADNASKSRLPV